MRTWVSDTSGNGVSPLVIPTTETVGSIYF